MAVVPVVSVMAQAIAKVEVATRIGIRLPAAILNDGPKLYGSVDTASASAYRMELAYAKDCDGSSACQYAVFSGDRKHGPRGAHVVLAKGLNGTYVAPRCGASCSLPLISWTQAGVHYEIAAQVPNAATELRVLANSAITGPVRVNGVGG